MFRRRGQRSPDSPTDVYRGLRTGALEVTAAMVGAGAPEYPDVLGVVIDVPASGGMATVVAMADGTTSMYTSTGGGTLGAGSHEPVARASGALLAKLQELIEMFPADERTSLPAADLVQITIVTREGRRRANLPAAAFWGREPSTLVALIERIHEVIAAIRATEPA